MAVFTKRYLPKQAFLKRALARAQKCYATEVVAPLLPCIFRENIEKYPQVCYNNQKGGGEMNKRISRIISLIVQGVFSLVCISDVILCTIYRQSFDTDIGRRCAYIALDLTGYIFLFFVIALPISLLLNIIALYHNDEPQKKRRRWKFWVVLSPVFYILFWITSLGFFYCLHRRCLIYGILSANTPKLKHPKGAFLLAPCYAS